MRVEEITGRIVYVRAVRVLLDADLATLYGVKTRVLLQAVRRNARRFPADFVFQLENHEVAVLRSQSVISKRQGSGGRSYAPYVFTEHGAVMAATVLGSDAAVEMSILVVRAFVSMRAALAGYRDIGKRVDELERRLGSHDRTIAQILEAIRRLAEPLEPAKSKRIGFVRD